MTEVAPSCADMTGEQLTRRALTAKSGRQWAVVLFTVVLLTVVLFTAVAVYAQEHTPSSSRRGTSPLRLAPYLHTAMSS